MFGCIAIGCTEALSSDNISLHGKVVDLAGQPVAGAEVFIYDSTNTRRPADFITSRSDEEGHYSIHLPPGSYWAVARVRQGEKFGPLQPGARHSGEPLAIEITADDALEQQFVVADMREMAKARQRVSDDYVRVSGRIINATGAPVASAYVMANTKQQLDQLPEFVSGWTNKSGQYTLYLPLGSYFLAATTVFPPDQAVALKQKLTIDVPKIDIAFDVDLTLK